MKGGLSFSVFMGISLLLLQISFLATSSQAKNLRPPPALRRDSISASLDPADESKPETVELGGSACTPRPRPDSTHYVIGYGSLVQSASKERTLAGTGESVPVQVQGYRREWNLKGDGLGPDTTYLGVVPDPNSSFNGVIFQLRAENGNTRVENSSIVEAIRQYDEREKFYCRRKVDIKNIRVLSSQKKDEGDSPQRKGAAKPEAPAEDPSPLVTPTGEPVFEAPRQRIKKSEYWIYINKPEFIDPPTKDYPIVQSYVDVFISGCLELEAKFGLRDFAKNCVESTKGWSEHWINDRVFPRRPFVHQPLAGKIDAVLQAKIPKEFDKIQIE